MNDTPTDPNRLERSPMLGPDTEETVPPTPVPTELRATQPGASLAAEASPGDEAAGWYQDQIDTPPPSSRLPVMAPTAVRPAPRRQRPSCLLSFVVGLSLLVGLVSLALNVFLLSSLINVRQAAIDGLDVAIESLDKLQGQGFHYEYKYNDTLPVAVEIPVQQEMVFPFKGNFPINTTVQVPINAGVLGTFTIDVPINTNVPVDVAIPVQISQTVAISTSLPLSLTVPIDVTAEDPAIAGFIDGLQQWLLELRKSFDVNILEPLLGGR